MIHPSTRVLGKFGYGPVSLSPHLAVPSSWTGLLYYIFSEQSSSPIICTASTEVLTRSPKGLAIWKRVSDLERSMYIGAPMSLMETVSDRESTDVYKRQAWTVVIGHPRSVRHECLDDESAPGDVLIDPKRAWFKVHDIETSSEPATVLYRILDNPVLAYNVWLREYDSKRNTTTK